MTTKQHYPKGCTAVLVLIFLFLALPETFAGNRKMIEQRISELDSLNKQVVSGIPALPRYGKIGIKAKITPLKSPLFRIYHRRYLTELKTYDHHQLLSPLFKIYPSYKMKVREESLPMIICPEPAAS